MAVSPEHEQVPFVLPIVPRSPGAPLVVRAPRKGSHSSCGSEWASGCTSDTHQLAKTGRKPGRAPSDTVDSNGLPEGTDHPPSLL